MMSLFSSFDFVVYSLSFFSYYLFFFFFFVFWSKNFISFFLSLIILQVSYFYKSILNSKFKMVDLLAFVVFFLLLFFNFFSILPFFFCFSSQISINLWVSFSIWFSLVLFSGLCNYKLFISHLVPEGTPVYLIWFLFFVESMSSCIRPITLFVRLLANILAGHLLMVLLSKMVFLCGGFVVFYFFLNVIEIFVSFIQAYIFVTLFLLYFSEIFN